MVLNPSARRALAGVLLVLPPLAVLVAWLVLHDDLPDPVATHFGAGGEADGFSSPAAYSLVLGCAVVLVTALGVVLLVADRARTSARMMCGVVGGVAALLAGAYVDTLLVSRGLADAHTARSGWPHMVVVLVVAAALGLSIARLVPHVAGDRVPTSEPPAYRLAPGERAVWIGRATSRPMLVIGLVLLVAGAVLMLLGGWWGGVLLAVALALVWTHDVHVRVDDRGLRAHLGSPWPALRTPLSRISHARVEQIDPLRWGGWGYRLSRRGTAIIVRRGPGLVLSRRGGSDLAITVDDPRAGADLINALLARESS